MVNPTFNIGGLASGLDTSSIIEQLVQLERQPIVRFQQRQNTLRQRDDAWGTVVQKLSGLRASVDAVRDTDALRGAVTVASSDESAVTVTANGNGAPGTQSFRVTQLAARHGVAFDGVYAGGASDLVGAGTLTLTDADGAQVGQVTTDGETTLAELVRAIDDLGIGVDAQILKVGDGDHRLVIDATATGAAKEFGVSTDIADLGAAGVTRQGADAVLRMGTLDVTRSSNTIDDLLEGATIRLRSTTTGEVTVTADRDLDAVVATVKGLVDGFNGVLGRLGQLTSYDPETGRAGVLQGDGTARDLAVDLRSTLTRLVGVDGDAFRSASDLGIQLTRDGTVELDSARLRAALEKDFDAATGLFGSQLTGGSGVELLAADNATRSGDFQLEVTRAATVAARTGAAYSVPVLPSTFTVTQGDTTVSVTIDAGMDVDQAVARINDAVAAESLKVRATADAGAGTISMAATVAGSPGDFTVADFLYAPGLNGTHTGDDVQVTIDGEAVTGTGNVVEGVGAAEGLRLRITSGLGTHAMSYTDGVAAPIDRYVATLEGAGGRIQQARDSIDSGVRDLDDQIERFETRVAIREQRLRRQFTGLESALGRLQSQGQWLAGQLASLGG